MGANPLTGNIGCFPGHVLPRRIAGTVIKSCIDHVVYQVLLDFQQLANRGRGLSLCLDGLEIVFEPQAEIPRIPRVTKHKYRRTLHGFARDGCHDSATFPNHSHAPVIAGDQSAFDRGHGNVELTLGMLAIDQQGSSHTDWQLGDTKQVLTVSRHTVWVKGKRLGVFKRCTGFVFEKLLAFRNDLTAVVVVFASGDFLAHAFFLHNWTASRLAWYDTDSF